MTASVWTSEISRWTKPSDPPITLKPGFAAMMFGSLFRTSIMFDSIPPGPDDPMFFLKKKADEDTSPEKVDIGVGIYRNERGTYEEFAVVKEASDMR